MLDPQLSAPRELRLHVGAHKTATTHLQDALYANRKTLVGAGCGYLPRDVVRKTELVRAVHENHWNIFQALDRAQSLEEIIVLPEAFPQRILISEEDILGLSVSALDGLYPMARRRLLPWSFLRQGSATQVFLSIRNQADMLPSAYSQALRDGPVPRRFASYKQEWLANRPSWMTLMATIVDLFGEAQFTVWTMEHYLKDPQSVMKALCGTEVDEVLTTAPSGTRRLSSGVVMKIEELDPSLNADAWREAVHSLMSEDEYTAPFDPLSDAEKALLSDCYRKDIERLRRSAVRFLG